jgi:hypothetical protein
VENCEGGQGPSWALYGPCMDTVWAAELQMMIIIIIIITYCTECMGVKFGFTTLRKNKN